MIRKLVVALAAAVSMPALAATATITRIDGNVMVNQGEQFRPAQAGQTLNTGDRIMVPQGGSAALTFDDGCAMDVQSDTLVTIPSMSTCAGGQVTTQRVTPSDTTVGTRPARSYVGGGDSAFGWAAMGTIVAITAYMITEDDDDEDDDDTTSP